VLVDWVCAAEAWRTAGGFPYCRSSIPYVRDAGDDLGPFFDLIDYAYFVVTVRAPDAEMSGCLAGS